MARYVSWSVVLWGSLLLLGIHISETLHSSAIKDRPSTDHLYHRRKRDVTCKEKYATITEDHTACLQPSNTVKAKGVTDAEKAAIVDQHNKARREVSPSASNMMLMSWDDEVANIAQRWAENCVINHDNGHKRNAYGRFTVGQNLSWGSWKMTWGEAIKLWTDEKKDYVFGGTSTGVVGHYTQMVWATSIKVGCGYAQCGGTHYYVCNYGPAGNLGGANPYKRGSSCSACSGSNCNDGLCDCGGKVCLNGGDLDPKTCGCSCTENAKFYLQPDCKLNCTGIVESWKCRPPNGFTRKDCLKFSNVPEVCPLLCGYCPTAGAFYKIDTTETTPMVSTSTTSITLSSLVTSKSSTPGSTQTYINTSNGVAITTPFNERTSTDFLISTNTFSAGFDYSTVSGTSRLASTSTAFVSLMACFIVAFIVIT